MPDINSLNFEKFKKAYPTRSGGQPWQRAKKSITARFRESTDLTWAILIAGAARYATYCGATNRTGTEYVMQAATFCGPDKGYLDPWDIPSTKSEARQDKNVDAGLKWLDGNG